MIKDANIPAVQSLLDFRGKTVIVTGAGRGIGAGIAKRFAQAGANVVVHYRQSVAGAARVVTEIETFGGKAMAVQADVSQPDGAAGLVSLAVKTFGRVDVLVNNAGFYPLSPLLEMEPGEWEAVLDANLKSVFLCTQAAARQMIAQGQGGSIVNIASIEALNPAPGHSHYNAAKGGALMHTRAAANELGPHGIRVNAVLPGLIWRKGLEKDWPDGVKRYKKAAPLGRLGQPEDVADACLFLASPAARWISGAELVVDGGVMTKQIF